MKQRDQQLEVEKKVEYLTRNQNKLFSPRNIRPVTFEQREDLLKRINL